MFIYQIPHEWITNSEEENVLTKFELGYSTGCLRPDEETEHKIERKFEEKVYSSSYKKNLVNLAFDPTEISENKMLFLDNVSSTSKNLGIKFAFLANQMKISESSLRAIFKEIISGDYFIMFHELHFLSFYKYIGIIVKGESEKIEKLTNYLRQFFYFRFFTNDNYAFIHLRISPKQYEQLLAEFETIKHDFELVDHCLFEQDKHSFVKRSIDFKNASYSFDEFLGLHWEAKKIFLKENSF